MDKNRIFREYICRLTIEETANLCFKTARTVTEWDKGKPIPPECKRLMRYASKRCISDHESWEQFSIIKDRLEIPTGQLVTPQQVVLGIALLSIKSELELRTTSKLVRYARVLARMLATSKHHK